MVQGLQVIVPDGRYDAGWRLLEAIEEDRRSE